MGQIAASPRGIGIGSTTKLIIRSKTRIDTDKINTKSTYQQHSTKQENNSYTKPKAKEQIKNKLKNKQSNYQIKCSTTNTRKKNIISTNHQNNPILHIKQ